MLMLSYADLVCNEQLKKHLPIDEAYGCFPNSVSFLTGPTGKATGRDDYSLFA